MINQHSSTAEKIVLFQSLFRGRSDVYPRRFQNRKTQKSGYAPACSNEWVRNICQKPRIKCMDCQYRQFIPIDDEVVYWHLQGYDKGFVTITSIPYCNCGFCKLSLQDLI